MKKLSYYLKQHIGGYTLAILSMVAAVGLDLWSPQLKRLMVDDVILGGQLEKLKYLLGAFLLFGIGRGVFQYSKEFMFDLSLIHIYAAAQSMAAWAFHMLAFPVSITATSDT